MDGEPAQLSDEPCELKLSLPSASLSNLLLLFALPSFNTCLAKFNWSDASLLPAVRSDS